MMPNKQIKVIFLGSANFSVPILEMLIAEFTVVAIVTEVDKQGGRNNKIISPPVKQIAQLANIPCLQPESLKKDKNILEKLAAFESDVFVVAAYGKILPIEILNLPPHGCLNIHPSLLPKYRGASPIQSCLLNGDSITGTSIILMDSGMDTGDILAQQELAIENDENYNSLSARLAGLSARILKEKLPKYIAGGLKLTAQIEREATFCRKITKGDGRINWHESAVSIANKVRAFCSWPGTFTFYNGKKLDIIAVKIKNNQSKADYPPGQVFSIDNSIYVACAPGVLELLEVKLEGKNSTPIKDFVNGHQDFLQASLL